MFLAENELNTYYLEAAGMTAGDRTKYLGRANSYCYGVVGGTPPTVDANLKHIVAAAFEIMSEGQTAQTDPVNGNITEAAPPGAFNRSDRNANPLATVDKMLLPYKRAYEAAAAAVTDRGVSWLGG
jgi:hypothetical protein